MLCQHALFCDQSPSQAEHFLGEPVTLRTTTTVSTVREEYSAMPRFHSVWFFLIEHWETDMAIAIDVDGDD